MNRYLKNQLKDILNTVVQAVKACKQISAAGQQEQLLNVLTQIQETAIEVGNEIEHSEGSDCRAVRLLEEFCEQLWRCTQAQNRFEQSQWIIKMEGCVKDIVQEVSCIEVKAHYTVAFFPYKASMWDCMESVWAAAKEDLECEVYVVPIPYYDLVDGEPVKEHYEIDKFPDYVQITDYRKFKLEERRIDMAYIHNPFDQFNLVTTVHPKFYSKELKQYVEKLVYIPYYVTGNEVFVSHRELYSYYVTDFIVTQSEKMIESYAAGVPREKFLPFGSPIVDRILLLESQRPAIPKEWRSMLPNGRDFGTSRTVMLNASISILMKERERYLDKLEYVIQMAGQMKNILIIWRPHPLLHSTAETMGTYYIERLKKIEEDFLKNKTGVLDTTADVGITVALCDAYLGETASSLIHMFGIARKPRFYFKLKLKRNQTISEPCRIYGKLRTQNREYVTVDKYGVLFEHNLDTDEYRTIANIPGADVCEQAPFQKMTVIDNTLYLQPYCARGIMTVNLETLEVRQIFPAHSVPCGFCDMEADGAKLYFRPEKYEKYLCFDTVSNDFDYYNKEEELPEYIAARFKENEKKCTPIETITIPEALIARIRAEQLMKSNFNHEWHENDQYTLEDYFYYLQAAQERELRGTFGMYQQWLATLDGTCGKKIHEAVKRSLE